MEREKLLIDILKVKLLFFVTFTGGVFGLFIKSHSILNEIVFALLTLIGVIGVMKNLKEMGELYSFIKDKK